MWATSIFWSRGLALPVTYTETADQQQQQQHNGTSSGGGGGVLRIKVLEGLVPGLDLANHSSQVWLVACRCTINEGTCLALQPLINQPSLAAKKTGSTGKASS